ncbi:uncharacterized protein LOC107369778 [Tetranychus urticae]|uniref:uncharacterized protein LOC107369778 n=1 Tax=Tetranychus urticae TaxID=32264 RepID=UPI00077BF0D8|nr:uncharacterized protein LOC107369778 [Tetranychus urticae]
MNIKLTKAYQLVPNPLMCILLTMLSLFPLFQPVISSMKPSTSSNETGNSVHSKSTVNPKDQPTSSSSYEGNHIFKYHCSPWIEEKVWNKVHPKARATCPNEPNGCSKGKPGKPKKPVEPSDSMLDDVSSKDRLSDTIILDDSKLPSTASTKTSKISENRISMWPTHPLPRRMSDNLSPSVCGYTGSNTVNDTLDWMQDYLHMMRSYNYAECLLLDNSTIDSICSFKPNKRIEKIKSFNLAHCDRYPLVNVLSDDAWAKLISSNTSLCVNVLQELNLLDSFAKKIYCQFEELLSRYKCDSYSIKGTCSACKKAYKEWVCSMVLPFYFDGIYIKPCRSFCEKVEQKCPHLHPATTYAGEPVFICIDPKIPYFRNSSNIPYGPPSECYESCHLANETDLYSDKVDRSSCPSYESLLANVLKQSLKEEMDYWKGDSIENNYSQASSFESNKSTTGLNKVNKIEESKGSKLQEKVTVNVHVRRSSSSFSLTSKAFTSSSLPPSTSLPLLDRRPRDRLTETVDSVTTDAGANLDSGLHKSPGNGIYEGEGLDGRSYVHDHVQSMTLPLDDDGSDDEGERDDDSISTTSTASSTLPSVSPSTHFSVQSSLSNAHLNLALSNVYHFYLAIYLLGLAR